MTPRSFIAVIGLAFGCKDAPVVHERARTPSVTLRLAPHLAADLSARVGSETAARLTKARDAGLAFAKQLELQGVEADNIGTVFTQLAFDVAVAERDTAAVQSAAQNAIDGLRPIIPASALPQAERELTRFTGAVRVTFTHPTAAEWERAQARLRRSPEPLRLP